LNIKFLRIKNKNKIGDDFINLIKATEGQKKIILVLDKENVRSYSELARLSGLSIQGSKKVVELLIKKGIVKYNPTSENRYSLNRKAVEIKRSRVIEWAQKSDIQLFKSLMMPVTIGMFIALISSFAFLQNALIFALGGVVVFLPQFIYCFYKIIKSTKETVEVFLRPST
jgi:DNA-binding MarR family transcriptional regulator